MRSAGGCLAWIALLACAACVPAPTEQPAYPTGSEYVADIESYREARVERLKTSWLALVGLYWLEPGDNAFGSGPGNKVLFPAGAAPDRAGTFVYADGTVTLVPEQPGTMSIGDEPVDEPVDMTSGDEPPKVTLGRLSFIVIERNGRHAVRLWDPEASSVTEFHRIEFYPIDETWVVEGRLVPYEEPKTMMIETVIGIDAEMTSVGRVEFDLPDGTHSLEALKSTPDATELFLIFKDGTTGKTTYPSGRYLYAPLHDEHARIDFNKAYNPPCAFTPYATCPLPPKGNTLQIAVEAGEHAYHVNGS